MLLPADVNRSLQDKSFSEQAPHYAKQNLLAASLTPTVYQHQPQFTRFISERELPFAPHDQFGKDEQAARTELIRRLCDVWSPNRLDALVDAHVSDAQPACA